MSPLYSQILRDALRIVEEQRVLVADAMDRDVDQEHALILLAEFGRRQAELRRVLGKFAGRVGLPAAAKPRILRYLIATKGKVVDKDELSGVSGIYEWARRLRELRVEEGWPISSNENRAELRPGQYVLEAVQPDAALKERWQLAHRIRNSAGSASSRILAYFRANVGKPLSPDELFYVAHIHEYPRRIRELVEEGWPIESHLERYDLASGQYVLLADRKGP
jgi:hypothetical protein